MLRKKNPGTVMLTIPFLETNGFDIARTRQQAGMVTVIPDAPGSLTELYCALRKLTRECGKLPNRLAVAYNIAHQMSRLVIDQALHARRLPERWAKTASELIATLLLHPLAVRLSASFCLAPPLGWLGLSRSLALGALDTSLVRAALNVQLLQWLAPRTLALVPSQSDEEVLLGELRAQIARREPPAGPQLRQLLTLKLNWMLGYSLAQFVNTALVRLLTHPIDTVFVRQAVYVYAPSSSPAVAPTLLGGLWQLLRTGGLDAAYAGAHTHALSLITYGWWVAWVYTGLRLLIEVVPAHVLSHSLNLSTTTVVQEAAEGEEEEEAEAEAEEVE